MDEENLKPYNDTLILTADGLYTEKGVLLAKRRSPKSGDSDAREKYWQERLDDIAMERLKKV